MKKNTHSVSPDTYLVILRSLHEQKQNLYIDIVILCIFAGIVALLFRFPDLFPGQSLLLGLFVMVVLAMLVVCAYNTSAYLKLKKKSTQE